MSIRDDVVNSVRALADLIIPVYPTLPIPPFPTHPPAPIPGRQGALAYQQLDDVIYYCDGTQWLPLGTGFQGFQGSQGIQGFQGGLGAQGNQGAQGRQGAQGFQGAQGGLGAQGSQGAQGRQGSQGSQGFQGGLGAQGTQGSQGNQGFQGAQGGLGAQGTAGVAGVTAAEFVQFTPQAPNDSVAPYTGGAPTAFQFNTSVFNDIIGLTSALIPGPGQGTAFTFAAAGRYVLDYEMSLGSAGSVAIYTGATAGTLAIDNNSVAGSTTATTWIHGRSVVTVGVTPVVAAISPVVGTNAVVTAGTATGIYMVRLTIVKVA